MLLNFTKVANFSLLAVAVVFVKSFDITSNSSCFFLSSDRKIKIWEYKDGKAETSGSLIGSNASIASIDIDHEVNRL